MDLQRMAELDDMLQVFSFGFLQDAYNLIKMCQGSNVSIDEFLDYVIYKKENTQKIIEDQNRRMEYRNKIIREKGKRCPLCGVLLEGEFYTKCQRRDQITSGIAGAFTCPTEDCPHWEHSTFGYDEYMESLGIPIR